MSDEQRQRARELLGRTLHKSKVATVLAKEFEIGRPHAYACISAAIEDFKAELAGSGEVDALTLAYAGLVTVAGADDAKARDRVAALSVLVKLLGLKVVKDLGEAGDIEEFLAGVLARRAARAGSPSTSTASTPPADATA